MAEPKASVTRWVLWIFLRLFYTLYSVIAVFNVSDCAATE